MPAPEIGQFVLVRKRPALVRNQSCYQDSPSGRELHELEIEYIDGLEYPPEDKIIWEREIGAKVFSSQDFPDISHPLALPDRPTLYEAFLNAFKWSSNCIFHLSTNQVTKTPIRLLSPWYSAIKIEDYQLYPVLKAMEMPRVNLLLADDVGLGKTIEAGLIMQELIRQRRLRRIMIICPSSLQIQWQDEMKEKFNIDFVIVDSDKVYEVQRDLGVDANPWMIFPKIITSMDYIKQSDVMGKFIQACRSLSPEKSAMLPWDMLIVDECHNFTPSKFSDDSARCKMLRDISIYFEHKLFLSATPHNGYTLSFSGMMELLDPVRFHQKPRLEDEDFIQLQLTMIRRMKSELNEGRTPPRFPNRNVEALLITLRPEEIALYNAMREYHIQGLQRFKRIGKRERNLAGFLFSLLTKRLLSSSYAFARTWWQHIAGFKGEKVELDAVEESMKRAEAPVESDLERGLRELDVIRQGAAWMTQYQDQLRPFIDKVSTELRKLGWTEEIVKNGIKPETKMPPDGKWERLFDWIKTKLMEGKRFLLNERVILFTEYKDTLDYLYCRFDQSGINEPILQILSGDSHSEHRRLIKNEFNDPISQLRILLATDVASEGLNLQTSCRYVIHIEIPWNPMRLEQRNGRVDRHGQSRDVTAFHFLSNQIEDLEFLDYVARKVNTIREDLGSAGLVLDEAVTEHFMTGRVTTRDIDDKLKRYEANAQDKRDLMARSKGSEKEYNNLLDSYAKIQSILGLTESKMGALLREAVAIEKGALREIEPGVFRFERVPPAWERLVKNTIAVDHKGITGAFPKLVFSPKRCEKNENGRMQFRPTKDTKLLMLSHPVMAKSMSIFKRHLRGGFGESPIKRWTIVQGPLPIDCQTIFVFSYLLSLRNRLGERYQTGLIEIPVSVNQRMLSILSTEEVNRLLSIPLYEIPVAKWSETLEAVRKVWPRVKEWVSGEKDRFQSIVKKNTEKELEAELKKQVRENEELFAERLKSLEQHKDIKFIEKLRKELYEARQLAMMMAFSEEKNEEHRREMKALEERLSHEEWERQHSHIELLKERLAREKKRLFEQILPNRYSLDENGVDVQPLGVMIIVNSAGKV
ncbi:MAG: DISARM system SNF2-like helicase DrmD [Thermoplasmata archaeon]